MSVDRLPAEVAALWRPQRPGRFGARDIPDALVEPDWGGLRVVAALTVDDAAMYREGEVVSVPAELLQALLDGFGAVNAVVEGHITTAALRSGEGAFPEAEHVERPPILVPRVFRSNVRDDPYVHSRDHEVATEKAIPVTLQALARGEKHAFVATDLLWIDGEPLDDVPLLERKRLLEAILAESFLVRVSAFVRPSAMMTLVSWASLGFQELSYRAANSRYVAGEINDGWAIVKAPDTPTRAPTAVPPAR